MLRAGRYIATLALSLSVMAVTTAHAAESFGFLPQTSPAAKDLQSQMASSNYRQALTTWSSAYAGSTFAQSPNGIATFAFLLSQNGMPFLGAEFLVQSTQPAKLDAGLLKLWTQELKNNTFVQHGWIPTTGGWKTIVNNDPVRLTLKNKKDITAAFARAERLPKEQVNARARVWWQIATLAPQINEVDSALNALKLLKESGQGLIGPDMIASAYGRVLYQKGDMDAALLYFKQIPKSSSLWVEAVEERAWSSLRKDDFDAALGTVTTLMSPALAPLVGPESYFLSNLMSLKVCDYPRLFKTSETFKKRHRDRLVAIQELAKTGRNTQLATVLENFDKNGVTQEAAGPLVWAIPRAAYRDAQFKRYMDSRHALLSEAKRATELAGGNADLERVAQAAAGQAERMKPLAEQRLRTLATAEVKEYKVILNKMHIVEAEVIERLHLDDNLKGQRSKLSKNEPEKGDVLVFPYRSDEVWVDELDNYKARVKDCPTLKGASL